MKTFPVSISPSHPRALMTRSPGTWLKYLKTFSHLIQLY